MIYYPVYLYSADEYLLGYYINKTPSSRRISSIKVVLQKFDPILAHCLTLTACASRWFCIYSPLGFRSPSSHFQRFALSLSSLSVGFLSVMQTQSLTLHFSYGSDDRMRIVSIYPWRRIHRPPPELKSMTIHTTQCNNSVCRLSEALDSTHTQTHQRQTSYTIGNAKSELRGCFNWFCCCCWL